MDNVKFNLDIPKIGHVMACRYEREKHFNLFSEGIYRRQLLAGFKKEDALYTHVAISSGGPYVLDIMPPKAKMLGVRNVPGLYGKYKGRYVKFLRYKGEDFDNKVRYKIASIYNGLAANLGYDFLGVAAFVIPGVHQVEGKPFCSEVSAEVYQLFYPGFFDSLSPHLAFPAYFVSWGCFDIHWEGYIE